VNVKGRKTSWVDSALWSFLAAVLITGLAHAMAVVLPDQLSKGAARQASSFEKFANRFAEYWLTNVIWLAALVAGLSFALVLALLLMRAKSASPAGSGAESVPAPPGNS
jgi:hypothetical protein